MAPGSSVDAGRPSSDAGSHARTEPAIVVERPPPGLARGYYAWPAWAVLLIGAIAVLTGLGYLAWRLRRRSRA
jgi:hypothetical protein